MAEGLPTPKSREQILSEMLTEYVGLTGINDLNTGSAITQFFDVVARSVARTSGDIFQILRDFSVDRATDEALNRIGNEERVFRRTAQVASGTVKITDTTFGKISTKIYAGTSAPNIGSTTIKVSDASNFPTTGTVYIGRGTPNIEGPLNYIAITQVGSYWEITLASPTSKFHNISESVILGQGGTRNIPVGTVVLSPGVGALEDTTYSVSSAAILLDGENENPFVKVVADQPGSSGNAPAGAIRQFSTPPFTGAAVINTIPFTTGADNESDDNYRDRIKRERLSRGLGTALAVKNSVLGAQASDENARVTSSEIDTTNPEETILYIDNGEGYEEKTRGVGLEFLIDSAIGGETSFQLNTGGVQTSVARAFLESSNTTPFDIRSFDRLAVVVGGVVSEHVFGEDAFKAQGAATAYEVVASINDNPDLTFEATTGGGGTTVVIRAKTEDNEFLQLTSPSSGTDAGVALALPSNEVSTVLLYRNRELLNKNGRSAIVFSKNQFDWSPSIADGDTLIISVDGTQEITYTFLDEDFISEGQHSIVNNQNSLSSWSNVINTKVTGITAEVNGEQLKLTSNLGPLNRASISINPASTLVTKGMFSEVLGLTAQGNEADFDISRNTAQIKLKTPLSEGDSLNLGSAFTRAEITSDPILGGQTTLSATTYLWLVVDDKTTESVRVGVTADTFLTISKPGGNVVRYESSSSSAFDNVEVGDYVIIWSEELSVDNRLEGRVNAVTSTTLDLKVTAAEEAAAVLEGPILFSKGFTVIRTEFVPQKIRIDAGIYDINEIASIMNDQLDNASVKIDNDEVFVIRTNTEDIDGALFLADFNSPAQSLNLTKNSSSVSINSQIAFYETGFKDRQFPAFVHGKITSDVFADPPNGYIASIDSSEDLSTLGLDPSGFICFSQPYGAVQDIMSSECVDIEKYIGTTINVEESVFYRRSRVDDRYHVLNGYDFGHNDSLVVVLDNDPTGKTFSVPLYRTATANITLPSNPNNFRAYDTDGGPTTEFTEFFETDYSFDNYKVLMQARNAIDPLSASNEDAVFYQAVEWGRSGEKIGIGYFYPTTANQPIFHIVDVKETASIKIFLKSGATRLTAIDGTTEWNVTVIPFSASVDLVTYTYSGTGTAPGLGSVIAGDYVSISSTGEFSKENQGGYRVDSATASSFTIRRATGTAVVESNIATLQTTTVSFFQSSATTAQEIVDYVTNNMEEYITAYALDDNGTTGAGVINRSTEEDSDFSYSYIYLKDGKNYILSTDLDAGVGFPQFVFKTPLDIPTYSTNTADAYSFNNGEVLKLIPITSMHLTDFLNTLAVTGFSTLGEIKSVDRNTNIQLSTGLIGTQGAVQIAGGTANASNAAIDGSALSVGPQGDQRCIVTIEDAGAAGFHSDEWVKVFASDKQRKITSINALNSIRITSATPSVGFSKIEFFDRTSQQRFLGRNRYHTRTRGRTFKVEKQGQFTCISWDENGTSPDFLKTSVNVKDSSSSTLTLFKDQIAKTVDITVDTGDMRFDEINIGDIITISNRANSENNGDFIVIGRSNNAKTLKVLNPNGINELVSGSFTITDNTQVFAGDNFVVGGTTLVADTDFLIGATADDTASNLSAAIALISNITSTSILNVTYLESTVPGVTIAISTDSAGASASGAFLAAPISNTGDVVAESEVQEGDLVTISSDFNILNQGKFRVIRRFKDSIYIDNSNVVEEEVTLADQFLFNGSLDVNLQKFDGYNRLSGTAVEFEDARPGDLIILGAGFDTNNQGSFHVINSGTNFVDFINVNGVDESLLGVTVQIHQEAMKFKEYEGISEGDLFVITNNFLGGSNEDSYVVSEVLNESTMIVSGNTVSTGIVLLDFNFNKIYIEEEKAYLGYKKIDFIIANPANLNAKNVVFDTDNQFEKINEIGGVSMSAVSKFSFPTEVIRGIDAYKYNIGLIAEANRIVYGDPRDNTTYPGVAAAGAEIFIKAPLIKRIQVSINVRVKTGVPFTTIVEEVRNSVSALINSNAVGQSIPISNIISEVASIVGIRAVAISSPQYDPQNDIIRVNSGEKTIVLDSILDIVVSKIE